MIPAPYSCIKAISVAVIFFCWPVFIRSYLVIDIIGKSMNGACFAILQSTNDVPRNNSDQVQGNCCECEQAEMLLNRNSAFDRLKLLRLRGNSAEKNCTANLMCKLKS